MHANMHNSTLSSERLQGAKLRPSLLGLVCLGSPLPCLRGEACGLAKSAQPGPQLYPPSQLPTLESQTEQSGGPLETLERVTVRGRGLHGQEPTYCVHSPSLTQSVTTSHTPPPILTCLFIFYTPTHYSVLHTFSSFCTLLSSDTFLRYPLRPHNSCLTAPLRDCTLSTTRSTI